MFSEANGIGAHGTEAGTKRRKQPRRRPKRRPRKLTSVLLGKRPCHRTVKNFCLPVVLRRDCWAAADLRDYEEKRKEEACTGHYGCRRGRAEEKQLRSTLLLKAFRLAEEISRGGRKRNHGRRTRGWGSIRGHRACGGRREGHRVRCAIGKWTEKHLGCFD